MCRLLTSFPPQVLVKKRRGGGVRAGLPYSGQIVTSSGEKFKLRQLPEQKPTKATFLENK